jgi:hypothetical protein
MGGRSSTLAALLAIASVLAPKCVAQTSQAPVAAHRESTQEFIAKLNPQQKQQFDDALTAYKTQRPFDAALIYRSLLNDFPGDPILLKFASQNLIRSGAPGIAVDLLRPLTQADPDDWQAASLLTHGCADVGDKPCRDAGIAHMLDLHSRGLTPPQMQDYVVEDVKLGDNTIQISTSLVPWGMYHVYAVGRATDSAGKLFLSITLESNDFDQPGFAKDHPDQAGKGMRRFSIDSYRENGVDSSGQRTQTQAFYKFIDGQPDYETIREEFLKVATGKSVPAASRGGLKVP